MWECSYFYETGYSTCFPRPDLFTGVVFRTDPGSDLEMVNPIWSSRLSTSARLSASYLVDSTQPTDYTFYMGALTPPCNSTSWGRRSQPVSRFLLFFLKNLPRRKAYYRGSASFIRAGWAKSFRWDKAGKKKFENRITNVWNQEIS